MNRLFTKTTTFLSIIALAILFSSCSLFNRAGLGKYEKAEIFSISKNKNAIVLDGVINSSALKKFQIIANENQGIKRIEIVNCDGSINDDVNLELAKYIYQNEYDIHLLDSGLIASGGTDLFLAGRKRTVGKNTKIGVHSWAGNNKTATDFPIGHANHLPYIEYYVSVGYTQKQAEDFYYFTINAAAANSIHWMTKEEIMKYEMTTP